VKRISGSRIAQSLIRVSVFLIMLALIAGMVSCGVQSYALVITSAAGGNVTTPGEGTFSYEAGTVVNLMAEAEEGYRFVSWTGNVSTIADVNAAATNITMNGDYSITANFVKQYNLTTSSIEGGSVTKPGEGMFTYDAGTVVDLLAIPDDGYYFANWTGGRGHDRQCVRRCNHRNHERRLFHHCQLRGVALGLHDNVRLPFDCT